MTKAEAALSGSSLRASSGSLGDSNVALRSSGPNKGPSLPVFDAVIGGNVAALAALTDEQGKAWSNSLSHSAHHPPREQCMS